MRAFTVGDSAQVVLAQKNRGRQFITIQPVDGDIYVGYDDSETAVSATNGQLVQSGTIFALVNTPGGAFSGPVRAISAEGDVDVRVQGDHVPAS